MYRLEIVGPVGMRVLEWDPDKLQQRDPRTIRIVAEADRLFKQAVAYTTTQVAAGGVNAPKMAVSGRWLA
jgi:hypothetical protein